MSKTIELTLSDKALGVLNLLRTETNSSTEEVILSALNLYTTAHTYYKEGMTIGASDSEVGYMTVIFKLPFF